MTGQQGAGSGLAIYLRLLRYTRRYLPALVVGLIGMVLAAGLDVYLASLMKPMMDDGFVGRDPDAIRWIPILAVSAILGRGILGFIAQYLLSWTGNRVIYDVRNDLFTRLIALPTTYFDRTNSGVLVSKIIYDIGQLSQAASHAIFVAIRYGLTVIGLLAWMFYLNWQITLSFMVMAPALAWIVRRMSRKLQMVSRAIQESMGDVSRATQETITGQRIVKAYGAQAGETARFRHLANHNRQQTVKLVAVTAGGALLVEFVSAIVLAVVLYIALQHAAAGGFSAGSFVSYISALTLLMPAAKRLTNINQTIQTGIAAAESAFSVMQIDSERDEGRIERDTIKGVVRYKDVCFRYEGTSEPALDGLDFEVKSGQMVALVGTSGSGKTTAASLLPRFYDVDSGHILIDDIDIRDYRLANLRRHIAWVGQETILFEGTIASNIAYGQNDEINSARLADAVEAAHVDEFASRLPEGLETQVGERGLRLSGGQRQRIAIARALYANAPILVLDEATSALDNESERHVQAAMEALMSNRTTIVIAHRLTTIKRADLIVVMRKGQVVEQGRHDELLELDGMYAGLHQMQFQAVE